MSADNFRFQIDELTEPIVPILGKSRFASKLLGRMVMSKQSSKYTPEEIDGFDQNARRAANFAI
jgi:hypothetical protein